MKPSLIALILVTAALGQYIDDFPWSDPIYIIDSPHGELDPVAKYTPSDEMFVVWFSGWPTVYYDVSYAQVAEDGTLTIPPTRIFEDGIDDRSPTVAIDSQGHAHIFWRRNTTGLSDIWYAQIDTANGSCLVNPKLLITMPAEPENLYMYAVPDNGNNIHLLYCISEWDGLKWWESPQHAKIAPDGTLLGYNHRIAEDSGYELIATWGEGIAVDSDGNVHVVYTFDRSRLNGMEDYSVVYRKIDGDDGTPLTPMKDLGYPGKNGVQAYEPSDYMPAICVDSQDHVHIAWVHDEDYVAYVAYIILDKDGDTVRDRRIVYSDEDVGFGQKNFFVSNNGRIILFANYVNGIGVLEFNEEGDLLRDPVLLTDVMIGHTLQGPFGCVGDSGHYRVVGEYPETSDDIDVLYVYQTEDWAADDPVLSADSASDGILLSWREEGELVGSTWFTLYTPYPCPATDRVTLSYYLPEGTKNVELSLYDLSGRLVASYVSIPTAPGRHEIAYDTSVLPAGVYLVRLSTDTGALTRRVVIAR
ncbi:MAG: T9SS type A sorting domain-containing protein [bacterium]|nr:T9SS type A sorting domain-containing protein [bacterium]